MNNQDAAEQLRQVVEYRVKDLVTGMEVAKEIYGSDGTGLVLAGAVLNRPTIEKLERWGVERVHVFAQAAFNPLADPHMQQFVQQYQNSVGAVEQAFQLIKSSGEIPVELFQSTAQQMTADLYSAGNILDKLYHFPVCDDYTFRHSVNVSIVAALIAMWLKYPGDVVNAVSLAALMHDIGKAFLPPELLNQPNKLAVADYLKYQQHVQYGKALLSKRGDISPSIAEAILQHHEREDGSGYPYALKGEEIHPYAAIIAVADVYDEHLTINRDDTSPVSPYTSLENLWGIVSSLNARVCINFCECMTNFLSGNQVKLTDGRDARVICVNKRWPSLSMVQLEDGRVIDLIDQSAVRINYLLR